MQQQLPVFNQSYQPGAQNVMMTSQTSNLHGTTSWVNPNPALSVDTVTINPSGSMSNLQRPNRQQQPSRGSAYPQHNSCETNNALPQLSIRDLQCLDTGPQASVLNQSESQQLYHHQQQQQQHQREDLGSETQAQNHMGNQNQGLQAMWSTFDTVQNTYNGSVLGGGGSSSQGLGSFPFLEGMEGGDFVKGLVGVGGQGGFHLKQEHLPTVGQESHASAMQSPRETQGNTYHNLLPRPMNNGTGMNLQNPFMNNGMPSEGHFQNLSDWIKSTRPTE